MDIVTVSDLHWEGRAIMPAQAEKKLGEGDILILAGDIINWRYLVRTPQCHFSEFLTIAKKRFKEVLAVSGNHEFYHCNIDECEQDLYNYYKEHGVKYLQNEATEACGLLVYGGTGWTDLGAGEHPEALERHSEVIQASMNDYRFIRRYDKGAKTRLLTPADTHEKHDRFIQKLLTLEKKPDIIVSHHAPHKDSVSNQFKDDFPVNYAYYTDLTDVIKTIKPKYWFHGHMHEGSNYKVDGTTVYCNPWGYRHENRELKLNEVLTIE